MCPFLLFIRCSSCMPVVASFILLVGTFVGVAGAIFPVGTPLPFNHVPGCFLLFAVAVFRVFSGVVSAYSACCLDPLGLLLVGFLALLFARLLFVWFGSFGCSLVARGFPLVLCGCSSFPGFSRPRLAFSRSFWSGASSSGLFSRCRLVLPCLVSLPSARCGCLGSFSLFSVFVGGGCVGCCPLDFAGVLPPSVLALCPFVVFFILDLVFSFFSFRWGLLLSVFCVWSCPCCCLAFRCVVVCFYHLLFSGVFLTVFVFTPFVVGFFLVCHVYSWCFQFLVIIFFFALVFVFPFFWVVLVCCVVWCRLFPGLVLVLLITLCESFFSWLAFCMVAFRLRGLLLRASSSASYLFMRSCVRLALVALIFGCCLFLLFV